MTRLALLAALLLPLSGCITAPASLAAMPAFFGDLAGVAVAGVALGGVNVALNVAQLYEEKQQRALSCYELMRDGYRWEDIGPYCPNRMDPDGQAVINTRTSLDFDRQGGER